MRVAALYDIHANLPALEAVLEEIERLEVDAIVVGGDVVPGPMPEETLAALSVVRPVPRYLYGNGERDVVAGVAGSALDGLPERAREAVLWTGRVLSREHLDVLASWPAEVRLEVAGVGPVLFCHATPRSDREIFTAETSEDALRPIFEPAGARVVVCGHTHMQFDRTVGAVRVVNAGSVGMPFGRPGAYWALLGAGGVELRSTPYDLEVAAERIRATSYPQADPFAERNVLHPPTEADVKPMFAKAALR